MEPQTNNYSQYESDVLDALHHDDIGAASQLSIDITEAQKNSVSADDNEKYEYLKVILNFIRFSAFDQGKALMLIETHLGEVIGLDDLDVLSKIETYVDIEDSVEDKINFITKLLAVFKTSHSLLSSQNININQQTVEPTIGNWLADYSQFPTKQVQRTNLDELAYANNSQNAKLLTGPDKKKLLKLLKIYDYVNSSVSFFNTLPVVETEAEAYKDFDLYKELPGVVWTKDSDTKRSSVNTNVPAPKSSASATPIPNPTSTPLPPVAQPQQRIPVTPPLAPPPPEPAVKNIQDIIRHNASKPPIEPLHRPAAKPSGIVYGGSSNVKLEEISRRLEVERQKRQVDVDKRLNELKKRKQTEE